jgi:hypothetical protein
MLNTNREKLNFREFISVSIDLGAKFIISF